jgi:YHS domain-containing protein
MWLRTLLLFLLVVFAVRFARRLFAGIVQGATEGGTQRPRRWPATTPVKMVADPVCGTFVVPGKALQLARGGETFYFCSEKCREQWSGR